MPDDVLDALETPEELELAEGETPEPQGETPDQGAEPKEGETEGDKTPVTSLFSPDGKKLDPTVRELLGKIRAEKPDAGKLLTKAVYRVAELDREFPGGLTEVRELRNKVDELGGVEGITEKFQDLAFFNRLDQSFTKSDPAFVDELVNAAPESFDALAPVVFDRYAKTNPDGFAAYLGRIIYGDFQRNDIPLLMARFQDVIGDNPKALAIFQELNGYLGGFKTLADKPAPAPKPRAEEPKPKTEDLSARLQEWNQETGMTRNSMAKSEFQRMVGSRKLDSEDRGQIETLYLSKAASLADKFFPNWKKTAQGYITSGNKAAYVRLVASIDKRVVPEAVSYAVSRTLRTPGKPATTPPTKKAPVVAGGKPAAAANGFKPVANEPSTWDIDFGQTNTTMLSANKAVLKNGNRVSWR